MNAITLFSSSKTEMGIDCYLYKQQTVKTWRQEEIFKA